MRASIEGEGVSELARDGGYAGYALSPHCEPGADAVRRPVWSL
jgi:hypothetical protein